MMSLLRSFKNGFTLSVFLLCFGYGSNLLAAETVSLFDGKSLANWQILPEDKEIWRVEDGLLTGGSLIKRSAKTTFINSKKSYQNFDLRFKIRLQGSGGLINSGMQVRSMRFPGKHGSHMVGYQVDAGHGWWGKLYDEGRGREVIAVAEKLEEVQGSINKNSWNEYRILAQGPRLRSWINGIPALDYVEKETNIPLEGQIALQLHRGGKAMVQIKEVTIKELPATSGITKWQDLSHEELEAQKAYFNKITAEQVALQKAKSQKASAKKASPKKAIPKKVIPKKAAAKKSALQRGGLTPEQARLGFKLPKGFTAELVASEEQGIINPITITWDHQGRMWTMISSEYPIDANTNEAFAEGKYKNGGKDKVLVFDNPYGKGPHTPRVFADGLVIPLGLMPINDGALVQYGHDIRYYYDRNQDGKAEGFETVLTGFGVQDSHLFPHQFTRTPGGWIYLAQGLFNTSMVKRPDGKPFASGEKEIQFDHAKLARMRLDGSAFELQSAGPNNIWGLVQARNGEVFLQEANDWGIPVVEFENGTNYKSGKPQYLRPYAPRIPATLPGNQMGGTGLSGLALVQDKNSPFQMGYEGKVFYLVNPITNRLQIVTAQVDGEGDYVYHKQKDFLLSDDKLFRPVAAHFGPDSCLYISDWYNLVISHNEVARDHPDRDKKHGRIWRICADSLPSITPPNLTQKSSVELLAYLGDNNALVARMAWQELADRQDPNVVSRLEKLILTTSTPTEIRTHALWALEGSGYLSAQVLRKIANDAEPALRVEALRAAAESKIDAKDLSFITAGKAKDVNRRVRAALANAVRLHPSPANDALLEVARLGKAPLKTGNNKKVYNRDFERYLARWAMEVHPAKTKAMLRTDAGLQLPTEASLLAVQSLSPEDAAVLLLGSYHKLARPFSTDEWVIVISQLADPNIKKKVQQLFTNPDHPKQIEIFLKGMLGLDSTVAADPDLKELVSDLLAVRLTSTLSASAFEQLLNLTRKFKATALAPALITRLKATNSTDQKPNEQQRIALYDTLREIQGGSTDLFAGDLTSSNESLRRAALSAYVALDDAKVIAGAAAQWRTLPGVLRQLTVNGLLASQVKAAKFVQAIQQGEFEGFDPMILSRLVEMLGQDNPALVEVLKQHQGLMQQVYQFSGGSADRIITNVNISGAFTLEAWVKLDKGIDNSDAILGNGINQDFSFHKGRLKLFVGKKDGGNVLTSKRVTVADTWIHYAITRNNAGRLKLYIDGELDQPRSKVFKGDLKGLNLGQSISKGNNIAGQMMEVRVWQGARSMEVIRRDMWTRFAGQQPEKLKYRFAGTNVDLELQGKASVVLKMDTPQLISPAEATAKEVKFAKYRVIAQNRGNAKEGKLTFTQTCLICHSVKGLGGQIGPDLSGAGVMGTEALLHNILTPNEQMESGYYTHTVTLNNGTVISGFQVTESKKSLTLLPLGQDEQVILKANIISHKISKQSLMPPGLIEGFSSEKVSDLFEYLRTLK